MLGSAGGVGGERDVERGLQRDDQVRSTERVEVREGALHGKVVDLVDGVIAQDEELVDELEAGREDLAEV